MQHYGCQIASTKQQPRRFFEAWLARQGQTAGPRRERDGKRERLGAGQALPNRGTEECCGQTTTRPLCVLFFGLCANELRQIEWHSQRFESMVPARTDCVLCCCRAAASSPDKEWLAGSFLRCNFGLLSVVFFGLLASCIQAGRYPSLAVELDTTLSVRLCVSVGWMDRCMGWMARPYLWVSRGPHGLLCCNRPPCPSRWSRVVLDTEIRLHSRISDRRRRPPESRLPCGFDVTMAIETPSLLTPLRTI